MLSCGWTACERRRNGVAQVEYVQTTVHYRKRMAERGFGFQDLLSILLNGDIKSQPGYDPNHDQFKYRVEGNSIDGDSAVAITVVVSAHAVLVVTIGLG